MNRTEIKRTNWVVYVTALVSGLIFTAYTFYETANPGTGPEAGQSRFGFSSEEAMMYSLISLPFIVLLMILWKRIAPYHVAALTFVSSVLLHNLILSVTIGWVGIAGMVILVLGVLLTICMIIFNFFVHRRLKKRVLAEG
ncbi:hypothetical protein JMA_02770 [Jeotgalibacillus malaysiensis]|uniref:Uncharacterized protein n=1 Tax=Jeotgalibacillus malaysiensis TaxID=1508404 RepID=A0A0B5ANL1_9BACL|nr:hypothetical protein [Jeotgalibacillus malaysiensis]AJD89594.1 hypothetical protein JMA_02770 [Jeotgalibacillus malaysiensis]